MPACSRPSRGRYSRPIAGVFVDVAQDVGQLQRAAEMMREQDAVVLRQAEHPHRQPSDRARDAVAIQIERREIRRPDILRHVHLHAVDDGQKILALQIEPSAPKRHSPATAPADGPDTARRYRRAIAAALPAVPAAARRNRRCRRPAGKNCRSGTSPRAARAAGCASRRRTSCRTRSCRNSALAAAASSVMRRPPVWTRAAVRRRGGSSRRRCRRGCRPSNSTGPRCTAR